MAPLWMHQQLSPTRRDMQYENQLGNKIKSSDPLMAQSPQHSVLIEEKKRMFLVEKGAD